MNIRDIARIANVTPGTVSKVINNYPDIGDATRQKVLKVIEEYQYTPVKGPNSPTFQNRKSQIAIVNEGVNNVLHSFIEEVLSIRLHNGDYTTFFYHDNYFVQPKPEKFQELLRYAENHNLAGLVYLGGNFADLPLSCFDKLPCSTVFVNTMLPEGAAFTRFSQVSCNHYDTGYNQMKQIIAAGHREIGILITSQGDNSVYSLRLRGYRMALAEHQLESQLSNIIEGHYTALKTYENVLDFLKRNPRTTAICCSADVMVPAALRAITDFGAIPGQDIALISFDGLELMPYLTPSIATYQQPAEDMITSIYDILLGTMEGSMSHMGITYETKFIPGESFPVSK